MQRNDVVDRGDEGAVLRRLVYMKLVASTLPPPGMLRTIMVGRPGRKRGMCRASARAVRSNGPPTPVEVTMVTVLPL